MYSLSQIGSTITIKHGEEVVGSGSFSGLLLKGTITVKRVVKRFGLATTALTLAALDDQGLLEQLYACLGEDL
jgi:hypothetical protein